MHAETPCLAGKTTIFSKHDHEVFEAVVMISRSPYSFDIYFQIERNGHHCMMLTLVN